ncbi:MAG: aromatic ring-hydroxylating oxygenase subunit alpha, partial [Candidatus Binataceae bacterium]
CSTAPPRALLQPTLLITAGKLGGRPRAFHNMCSHRGNQLVVPDSGKCKGLLTCKFHGWAYDLNGSLRHVSGEANFFDLDKASLALTPVAVDTWEGFVFINVEPHPAETLHQYLGEFGSTFGGYSFAESASTQFFWWTEIKANWKIVKDAFQEVWHIPFPHHKTVFYKPSNPYGSAMGFKLYGRHGKIYPQRRKTPPNEEQKRPQMQVESLALRYGSGPIHRDKSGGGEGNGSSPKRSSEFVLVRRHSQ